ncbi:type II toxin-antitoxin system RelB/DinJ family antitoxin [Lactiplantibacillus plantarum]|uniref:type II toxin-antitoxin system RelB/DinJ family antitoxin n=1 Tax=Lactiplantibacillus plantarum TaxID=1590 RepID=UPI0021CB8035|nr:type II toxin-antitoxin system RelB/DinJ family antitoxin [Lactiplantibacillus plantarum]
MLLKNRANIFWQKSGSPRYRLVNTDSEVLNMSNNSSDKTMFAMRIDKNEKEQLRRLYHDMGLDLSTAVNLFFKQSLLEEGLPFQPKRKKVSSNDD